MCARLPVTALAKGVRAHRGKGDEIGPTWEKCPWIHWGQNSEAIEVSPPLGGPGGFLQVVRRRAEMTEIPRCSSPLMVLSFDRAREGIDGPLRFRTIGACLVGSPCPASGDVSSSRFSAARLP